MRYNRNESLKLLGLGAAGVASLATTRASARSPVQPTAEEPLTLGLASYTFHKKYQDRLFDVHLKDVTTSTGDGVPLEVGRGVIDIPGFLRTLR